jgi:hypothetical protein
MAKCPHCGEPIIEVVGEPIPITTKIETWTGLGVMCPGCHNLLGITVDPMAWKTQLVREITAELTAQVEAQVAARLPPAPTPPAQKPPKRRR